MYDGKIQQFNKQINTTESAKTRDLTDSKYNSRYEVEDYTLAAY